jgi:hypothetical protein
VLDMDPGIRARWTAALRSGEYDQGQRALYDGSAFCCLGVLCDLAVRDKVLMPPRHSPLDGAWSYDGRPDLLPETVLGWAGLGSSNPEVLVGADPGLTDLTTLNDDDGWSFAQIADAIDGGAS